MSRISLKTEAPSFRWWAEQVDGTLPQAAGNYTFKCFLHDEVNGEALSLRVLPNGEVIATCHGKCGDQFWTRVLAKWKGEAPPELTEPEPLPPPNRRPITIQPGQNLSPFEALAIYTGVSVEFLKTLPLREVSNGVEFIWPGKKIAKTRSLPFESKSFSWHPPKSYNPPLWPNVGDELPSDIYITEGESDCIVLKSLGVDAYALTRGGAAEVDHLIFEELKKRGVQTVFLVPDVDLVGKKSASRLSRSISRAELEVRVVDLGPHVHVMDGEKDLRALYLRLGRNALMEILDEAFRKSLGGIVPPKRADTVLREEHTIDWIVPGLVARGSITLVNGQPKAGKTTFVMKLIDSLALGESFLNRVCKSGRVLYLTENRSVALQAKLELLRHREHVFVLDRYRREFVDTGWDEIVRLVFDVAKEIRADLVVLDTFMAWAQPEDENSSTEILSALDPLERSIQRLGMAMVIVHHLNKDGTSPRGSGAFQAECDTIANLTHSRNGGRRLTVVSNLVKEPLEDLVFTYDGNTYTMLVEEADDFAEAILAVFQVVPGPLSLQQVCAELDQPFASKSPDTVRLRLKKLVDSGQLEEQAGEKPNDPKLWRLGPPDPSLTLRRV